MSLDLEHTIARMKRQAAEQRRLREAEAAKLQADPEWQRQQRARVLALIGFGPRYQQPEESRIPSELAAGVNTYLSRLDEHLRRGEGIWLAGPVGVGKTHALAWLCAAVALSGYSVEYRNAPQLFNELARLDREELRPLWTCDLLAIDDLGTEYDANWPLARFHELVEYRYAHMKAVAITSNFPPKTLREQPQWERIVDRWAECMAVAVWQPGESQRKRTRK